MATFGTFVDDVSLKASELNGFLKPTLSVPVLRQSNVILPQPANSVSAPYGVYFQVNKLVIYVWRFQSNDSSGTGTGGNAIELDLPVTAASNSVRVIGSGFYVDLGAVPPFFRMSVVQFSTTKARFITGSATSLTSYLGLTNGPALTVANGDRFNGMIVYEAA